MSLKLWLQLPLRSCSIYRYQHIKYAGACWNLSICQFHYAPAYLLMGSYGHVASSCLWYMSSSYFLLSYRYRILDCLTSHLHDWYSWVFRVFILPVGPINELPGWLRQPVTNFNDVAWDASTLKWRARCGETENFDRFRRHISLNVRRGHRVWLRIFLVRSKGTHWYLNQNLFRYKRLQ